MDFWNDDEVAARLEDTSLFAKLSPSQKERIVKAAHQRGHVVGFMGDGINDAAALRASDVGISVDNAVDIAKESADIILLEISSRSRGRRYRRKTDFQQYPRHQDGCLLHFGNVFSIVGASILCPFCRCARSSFSVKICFTTCHTPRSRLIAWITRIS